MAVALSAIVLFALGVPGFLAWYGYRFDQQVTSGVHARPPFDHILFCSVLTVALHFAWMPLAEQASRGFGHPVLVNVAEAITLIGGVYDEGRSFGAVANDLAAFRWSIFLYLVSLYSVSFAIGWISRLVVLAANLDGRFPRVPFFQSEAWHELFFRARDRKKKNGQIAFTVVAFVMETSTGNFLYRGALRNFSLNHRRSLERITLYEVSRRRMPDDLPGCQQEIASHENEESRFYSIDVDDFVVNMEAVKNLAVFYVYADPPLERSPPGPPEYAELPPTVDHQTHTPAVASGEGGRHLMACL